MRVIIFRNGTYITPFSSFSSTFSRNLDETSQVLVKTTISRGIIFANGKTGENLYLISKLQICVTKWHFWIKIHNNIYYRLDDTHIDIYNKTKKWSHGPKTYVGQQFNNILHTTATTNTTKPPIATETITINNSSFFHIRSTTDSTTATYSVKFIFSH